MPKLSSVPLITSMSVYAEETNASTNIGQQVTTQDGRNFRYVQAGASNLVVGNVIQSPARDVQFTDMAVTPAIAVGSSKLTITNGTTATTLDMFRGGLAVVSVTPGLGQVFTITGNSVAASGAALEVYIDEPVITALTTSSKITLQKNQYDDVIQSPTTRTGKTVGVANFALSATKFGWVQSHGHAGALSDITVAALGESLSPSTTTAGATTKQVTLLETIGVATLLQVTAKVEPIWLIID